MWCICIGEIAFVSFVNLKMMIECVRVIELNNLIVNLSQLRSHSFFLIFLFVFGLLLNVSNRRRRE